MKNEREELLDRIAKFLMLHVSFNKSLGLLHGKMGAVLFFFHYGRNSEEKICEDFAGELITEICDEIHTHYPVNFENGLCGIAWGIEYVIQKNFVEADSNEILEDIDRIIFERDVRKVSDISLETGLLGIAHYVISRCSGKNKKDCIIPKEYIADLANSINSIHKRENQTITSILHEILYDNYCESLDDSLLFQLLPRKQIQLNMVFNKSRSLGIADNGYAGIGLNLILKRNEKQESIYI